MDCILGIDLGTSGTKTVLFDTKGITLASQTVEYPLYQPNNGWAEQDPEDWWQAVKETVRAVLQTAGIDANSIRGVGLSGQMHGLVMLDGDGNVLRRAILWCDGRTQKQCDEITDTLGQEKLIAITANPALPGFTAGKILWVREQEPEISKSAATFCCPRISSATNSLESSQRRCPTPPA